jgi:hypothetical protein
VFEHSFPSRVYFEVVFLSVPSGLVDVLSTVRLMPSCVMTYDPAPILNPPSAGVLFDSLKAQLPLKFTLPVCAFIDVTNRKKRTVPEILIRNLPDLVFLPENVIV